MSKCPLCQSPAFMLFTSVECSCHTCPNYREPDADNDPTNPGYEADGYYTIHPPTCCGHAMSPFAVNEVMAWHCWPCGRVQM